MDFRLSEELEMVRDAARDYAEQHVAPGAAERDLTSEFPIEPFRRAAEYGFTGVFIPEEFEGAGLGNLALTLILIEVNKACASTGVTLSVHNSLAGGALVYFANDEQRRKYLPKLASGEALGAYCLSEAGSGSDAAAMVCGAEEDGDDYVLNGTKLWVTNASHASLFIVFARTSREEKPHRGITCFIVDKDSGGLRVSKTEDKLGIRASSTCEIVLENCRVPKTNVIGDVGRGFRVAMGILDGGRIGIAAQAIGIARASLEASVKYAKERYAFGKPIASRQVIQFKVADMRARIEAAELLTLRAAWMKDNGDRHTVQAAEAKLLASRTANFCAREAVQIHGGAGYLQDFPVERYMRDARITEIYEGTTEIQKVVIAKDTLA